MYQYEYPHPAVTTDVVAFTVLDQVLQVLVIHRNEAPFLSQLSLPGGFVGIDEAIEDAACRVLNEKTPFKDVYLEQLYTFGEPQRDPRERVISVVYMAILPAYLVRENKNRWQDVRRITELAFDHYSIVMLARQRLQSKLDYSSIAFRFLPALFTLTEAQTIYEVILGEKLEKRNFRKQLLKRGILNPTGKKSQGGAHRPAELYSLIEEHTLQYW